MDYKIKEQGDELHVTLTVAASLHNSDPQAWTTNDVLRYLTENSSHEINSVLEAPAFGVRNHLGERHRTGTWVFNLRKTKQQTKTKSAEKVNVKKVKTHAPKKKNN
tara:strand:- start:59741 stop:60058 length:318 start_codon:yes stop_codon:yes gene_type:complete